MKYFDYFEKFPFLVAPISGSRSRMHYEDKNNFLLSALHVHMLIRRRWIRPELKDNPKLDLEIGEG